jgi:excisionase family DNA binding protein
MVSDDDKQYSMEEVADILRIDNREVLRYLERGKIKGEKTGLVWKITGEDLDNYIDTLY